MSGVSDWLFALDAKVMYRNPKNGAADLPTPEWRAWWTDLDPVARRHAFFDAVGDREPTSVDEAGRWAALAAGGIRRLESVPSRRSAIIVLITAVVVGVVVVAAGQPVLVAIVFVPLLIPSGTRRAAQRRIPDLRRRLRDLEEIAGSTHGGRYPTAVDDVASDRAT